MTTERPILFSAPMVSALLAGRKRQTRRVVKPQPVGGDEPFQTGPGSFSVGKLRDSENAVRPLRNPYGTPGDRLWVREGGSIAVDKSAWMYADVGGKLAPTAPAGSESWCREWKSAPSIHMPRWASRLTLEVAAIGIERLHEISEADARAEGMPADVANSPRVWYMALWDSINGAGSWDANPWVWVIEFRPVAE